MDEMFPYDWMANNATFDSHWSNLMRDIGQNAGNGFNSEGIMPVPNSPQINTESADLTSQKTVSELEYEQTLQKLEFLKITESNVEQQQQMAQRQWPHMAHMQTQLQTMQQQQQQQIPLQHLLQHQMPQRQMLLQQMLQQQQHRQMLLQLESQQQMLQQQRLQMLLQLQSEQVAQTQQMIQLQSQHQYQLPHQQFHFAPVTSNSQNVCDSQSFNPTPILPDSEANYSRIPFVPVFYRNTELGCYFEMDLSNYPMTSVPSVPVNFGPKRSTATTTEFQQGQGRSASVIDWAGSAAAEPMTNSNLVKTTTTADRKTQFKAKKPGRPQTFSNKSHPYNYVPDELKDEKYWKKRRANTIAVQKVRACVPKNDNVEKAKETVRRLEVERITLARTIASIKKENEIMKSQLETVVNQDHLQNIQ